MLTEFCAPNLTGSPFLLTRLLCGAQVLLPSYLERFHVTVWPGSHCSYWRRPVSGMDCMCCWCRKAHRIRPGAQHGDRKQGLWAGRAGRGIHDGALAGAHLQGEGPDEPWKLMFHVAAVTFAASERHWPVSPWWLSYCNCHWWLSAPALMLVVGRPVTGLCSIICII